MKVLGNYIAIQELESKQETASGIIMSATKNTNPVRHGVVVAVGPGLHALGSGNLVPTDDELKVGVGVLVNITNSLRIEHEGETLHLLKTTDVIAVLSAEEV